MNLPQFTAELALYRTSNVYREYGDIAGMESNQISDSEAQVQLALCSPRPYFNPSTREFECLVHCPGPPGTICHENCTKCGGTCCDLSADLNNCGRCGKKCESGGVCVDKICYPPCPNGEYHCTGTSSCFKLGTDSNCSTCGDICTNGQSCQDGSCKCPNGKTYCPGTGCVNLSTNSNHCGSCGDICTNGQVCNIGTCSCSNGEPLNSISNCGSCGNACSAGDICCGGECISIPTPDKLSYNSNYILGTCDCQPINGLKITLEITDDIDTSGLGFSLQLNAYNPQPSNIPANWLQFFIDVSGGGLNSSIQYNNVGVSPDIFKLYGTHSFYSPHNNIIYKDQKLIIALDYDPSGNGNITGADFRLEKKDGTVLGHSHLDVPATCTSSSFPGNIYNCQVPMLGFQVNIVGSPNAGGHSLLSSGSGIITYSTNGQQLCNQGTSPACNVATGILTCESSNVSYGAMSQSCGSALTQPFTNQPATIISQANGKCTGKIISLPGPFCSPKIKKYCPNNQSPWIKIWSDGSSTTGCTPC